MSFAPQIERQTAALADPKALLRVPVGLASPLWPLFAGAAMGGAAWWWMTRWTRPANLEAMFGAATKLEETVEAETVALAEPVVDALADAEPAFEAVVEAVAEPVVEAAPEPLPDPVLEALVEEPAVLEPIGGESAPISPVLEAMEPQAPEAVEPEAPAKPKRKAAPPSAD